MLRLALLAVSAVLALAQNPLATPTCKSFIPPTGIRDADPTAAQCGETWLLNLLRSFNSTQFASYVAQSSLSDVLEIVCALPQGDCKPCTQAYANAYNFLSRPPRPRTVLSYSNSSYLDIMKQIGLECGTTRNPFQVQHPSAATNTPCNLCARAFTIQHACQNTDANNAFGLNWFPFYPLAPNTHYPGEVGQSAGNWSVNAVCSCFDGPLGRGLDLSTPSPCLWAIYQSDPPLTYTAEAAAITSTL